MASDLARRRCSGEEQLLACGKIARGHTAKLLLDKIMANVLMETIMNPQGIMTQLRYSLNLHFASRREDAEKQSTVSTFCKADFRLNVHLLTCKYSQAPQFPPDFPFTPVLSLDLLFATAMIQIALQSPVSLAYHWLMVINRDPVIPAPATGLARPCKSTTCTSRGGSRTVTSILLLPADTPRPETGRGMVFTCRFLPDDLEGHRVQPRVAPRQEGHDSHAGRQVRLISCKSPLTVTRPFGRRTSGTQALMAAGCGQCTTANLQEVSDDMLISLEVHFLTDAAKAMAEDDQTPRRRLEKVAHNLTLKPNHEESPHHADVAFRDTVQLVIGKYTESTGKFPQTKAPDI
ncbi:hypothetical protein Anapl_04628 [Anas platyrhynchos]|uniref:Uncharacterized protein n=1 Tax=Anas platyrhynchos TaxID=8839 RepID=R0LQP9_ANAPL|nr:hypothetical protein Anapl_04628 [Anas platyrhynchos]